MELRLLSDGEEMEIRRLRPCSLLKVSVSATLFFYILFPLNNFTRLVDLASKILSLIVMTS
jgi:hypothetical protein